jgi:nitronate monooxygenase
MAWNATALSERLGIRYPLIQAPMAGGFTSPGLVAAVANAGGLGSFAAALLSPAEIRTGVEQIRRLTDRPFNVNLFVLDPPTPDPGEVERALELLSPIRDELGLPPGQPPARWCQDYHEQVETLIELRVPLTSFTFGLLDAGVIERLQRSGSLVLGTATNVAEARAWAENGAELVCAQGAEAGAHRGTFLGSVDEGLVGTLALVPQVVDAVRLPVVAAGGIADGRGIAAALMLGAAGVQIGTLFLNCAEVPITPGYRSALRTACETDTRVTRAFTGRYARGIVNEFMHRLDARQQEVPAYPVQNALTGEIRRAAAQSNRTEFMSLWAGQAVGLLARRPAGQPAADLMAALVSETEVAIRRVSDAA